MKDLTKGPVGGHVLQLATFIALSGRKDQESAELVFNQAPVLSNLTGLAFGAWVFALRAAYCRWLAANATTAGLGIQYRPSPKGG